MASGQPSRAAQRRRQRRLRSWWRHEQQPIAAALTAAKHHSAQQNGAPRRKRTATRAREEAGSETYYAPRGPKTLPPGVRPAPPSEVAGPQVVAATGGYVAAGAPLLAVSSLRGADCVDDTAVKFLLRAALKKKKKEEEEERQQDLADEALDEKLDAEMDALMAIGPERLTSRQHARLTAVLRERAELVERRKKRRTMRKRKKRSKRKLPKSSSGERVRRCGQGFRSRSSLLVLVGVHCRAPLGCRRPKMLHIMAGVDQKGSWFAQGWFFLVTMLLALCSSWFSSGPGCSTSWPVWTKRTVTQFLLVTMPLALFRRDSIGAVLGQFLGPLCATTGALVQGQFLDKC